MLQQAYGDSLMTMPMFYHWKYVFQNGRESVVDEPWERRPSKARDEVLQNTTAIIVQEDWRITVCKLTQCSNISVDSAFAISHDNVQMWCVSCIVQVGSVFAYTKTNGTLWCVCTELCTWVQGRESWILKCDNYRWVLDVSWRPGIKQQSSQWKILMLLVPKNQVVCRVERIWWEVFFMKRIFYINTHAYSSVLPRSIARNDRPLQKKKPSQKVEEILLHSDIACPHVAHTATEFWRNKASELFYTHHIV